MLDLSFLGGLLVVNVLPRPLSVLGFAPEAPAKVPPDNKKSPSRNEIETTNLTWEYHKALVTKSGLYLWRLLWHTESPMRSGEHGRISTTNTWQYECWAQSCLL